MTMMFLNLAIFLAFAVLTCSAEEGICQKAYCNETTVGDVKITYAAFVKVVDKAFTRTPNTTVQVSGTLEEREKNCVDHCISAGLNQCKSVHLEAFQQSNPTSQCSVYSTDVYQYWPNERQVLRETKTGWVSFHIKNTFCEKDRCENEAYCSANYTNDNGKCICAGYSGKFCKTYDVLHYDDVGHWTFNSGKMENVGLGNYGDGVNFNGKIGGTPGRKSNIMICNKIHDKCFTAPEASETNCLILPPAGTTYCPSGFTMTFWLRVLRPFTGSGTFLRGIPGGLVLAHISQNRGWLNLGLDQHGHYFRCTVTTNVEEVYRKWNFVGFTYIPATETFTCVMNDYHVTATRKDDTHVTTSNTGIRFGGVDASVLFDDIVYFERPSTTEMLKDIYEATKVV